MKIKEIYKKIRAARQKAFLFPWEYGIMFFIFLLALLGVYPKKTRKEIEEESKIVEKLNSNW